MSKYEMTREELLCKLATMEVELRQARTRKVLYRPVTNTSWWRFWFQGFKVSILSLVIVICFAGGVIGKSQGFGVHEWQKFKENVDFPYVVGFYHGMMAGSLVRELYPAKATKFLEIVGGWSYGQQIAIIDKFLKDNPDKWDMPFGVLVLTAYEGACKKRGFYLEQQKTIRNDPKATP